MRIKTLDKQNTSITFKPVRKNSLNLRTKISVGFVFEDVRFINYLLKKENQNPIINPKQMQFIRNMFAGFAHQMFGGEMPEELGFKTAENKPSKLAKTIFRNDDLTVSLHNYTLELPSEFIRKVFDKQERLNYSVYSIGDTVLSNSDVVIKFNTGSGNLCKTCLIVKRESKNLPADITPTPPLDFLNMVMLNRHSPKKNTKNVTLKGK